MIAKLNLPKVVSREEWLAARKALLVREKELTRSRDALSAERRRLPMVAVEEEYVFDGPGGRASLLDMFEGRLQLIVYHFMFDPAWDEGCRSCSAGVDEISRGLLNHLHDRGTAYAVVSRAPLAKIEPFKTRMGWTFPWYSSFESDFNRDYGVTLNGAAVPLAYNYQSAGQEDTGTGADGEATVELPGLSCFLRDGDKVFHTYSTYARGLEQTGGSPHFLDLTALGRQEEWEEPKGRMTGLGAQAGSPEIRYPDEYRD
ncbi:MAG: DUF899 domain-containing protein [Trueperaceae bacterium]